MAPEPAILKRQRSRPSEWWAAPLTSAPIDAIPPPRSVEEQKKARKKQMRGKIVGARISEAPAAGDKGVAKGKAGVKAKASRRGLSSGGDLGQSMLGLQAEGTLAKIKKGKEKGQGAPEKVKLLRSRSSSGEAELRGLGKCSQGVEAPVTHNRSKSTSGPVDQVIDELASTRGIKLTAARREERAGDDEREEATFARNRRGRATVSRSKDQTDGSLHQESGETAVAKNRGRKVIEQADELAEDEFEEPVVPRKRKRPTAAQSDNQVDELDKELEEVALRKNRRQPVVHVENEAGDVQPRVSKKRRRAALMETAVEPESGEPEPKKKHKRLSEAEILEQHSAHFAVVGSPVRGRTRHRASDIAAELSKVNAQETGKKRIHRPDNQPSNTSGVEPEDRGRRRTRSDAVVVKAVLESAKKLPGKFTKSNRQSEIIEVEAASSKLTNNRGDKQPKTTISSASVATVAGRAFSSTQASQKSKKAGQSSNRAITQKAVPALSQIRKKSPDRSTQVRRPSQKRRAANKSEPSKRQLIEEVRSQERSNEPEDELASYQHLKAVTRRISRQTIDAKWEPLQLNSVDCITQLLQDAQRPVLTRIHDEKKKTQASTALQSTSRNLIKKLKKGLPFPPGSRSHKEDDFDFEKVLDHSRALEAQLTPAMHSNSLLTAELSKEVALLESDKEKLAELEANARSEAAARSKAARKFHSVLQSDDPSSKVEALKDDIGLDITRQSRPLDLELHDDENLQALVKDLDGHVGTVQGNIQQIEGISQAIANSRAAVQASLFQRLDNAHAGPPPHSTFLAHNPSPAQTVVDAKIPYTAPHVVRYGVQCYNQTSPDEHTSILAERTSQPNGTPHNIGSDAMEHKKASNGQDAKPKPSPPASGASKSPKKRRKVNHACVYCRRSHMTCDLERPCARCIKRNIGHLCHDEPREPETATKKLKSKYSTSVLGQDGSLPDPAQGLAESGLNNSFERAQSQSQDNSLASLTLSTAALSQGGSLQLVQPSPVLGIQANALNSNSNQFIGNSSDWLGSQNQFQDMHNYHPSYMFNAPEVTNEYNLLNDFINNSLLDDGVLLPEEPSGSYSDQPEAMLPGASNINSGPSGTQPSTLSGSAAAQEGAISRPASVIPTDKAREYYLQAADPTGNDAPEERMQRLLKAKYDAGMLKPFNYVKGYARLAAYMKSHLHAAQEQKILQQLNRFRPKFREKVQSLTDIELIYVEMWFERSLMEYDRVFASMAIPACCWRRTGEIFRGNKEMAELIHVPIENLRDGKIAIHEILAEESLVSYWEKFGTIAFDQNQKALLTSCSLKNPDDQSQDPTIKCCFSFTIRRDEHKIPSLIVGNFLPQDPVKR